MATHTYFLPIEETATEVITVRCIGPQKTKKTSPKNKKSRPKKQKLAPKNKKKLDP